MSLGGQLLEEATKINKYIFAFVCQNQWGQFTQLQQLTSVNRLQQCPYVFLLQQLTDTQVSFRRISSSQNRESIYYFQNVLTENLFRFSVRFRQDLTFHRLSVTLWGIFPVYYTAQTKHIASKNIFLLFYVTFVDNYVLRSLPLMQANVALYKFLAKQQKT